MEVYIYDAAVGGNLVASGTTEGAGGMVANSFPVVIQQGAGALAGGVQYYIAVGGADTDRTPGTFLGVMGGIHSFAV